MLSLNILGSNKTELTANGVKVLFSYNTPVACWINGQYYKTGKKWSVTTSKHINSWVDVTWCDTKEQTFFDGLIERFNLEGVL